MASQNKVQAMVKAINQTCARDCGRLVNGECPYDGMHKMDCPKLMLAYRLNL